MVRKTAIIIGNGKLERDIAGIVDEAQFVMRFNEPVLSGGMSGERTDMIMLAASSKILYRRLLDPGFMDNAALKAAKVFMLAYHPDIIRKYHPRPNIFQRLQGHKRMALINAALHQSVEDSIVTAAFFFFIQRPLPHGFIVFRSNRFFQAVLFA